jgi:hypothetical protein
MVRLVKPCMPRSGLVGRICLGAAAWAATLAPGPLTGVASGAGAVSYGGLTSQHAGRYAGQSLPSDQVSFTLARGAVHAFSIPWVAACHASTGGRTDVVIDRTLVVDALAVRRGRFSARASYDFSPGTHQTALVQGFVLRGGFHGRRASGTLSVTVLVLLGRSMPVAVCQTSAPIHWSAVAGSGRAHLTAPATARPRPAEPGFIAYAREDPGGAAAIWLSDRVGRQRKRVTGPPPSAADTDPALPLQPYAMAYQRTAASVSQIYVGDPLGDPKVHLNSMFPGGRDTGFAAGARDPALAGDANDVAFSVGSGADCTIWVMHLAGTGQRRLTDHGGTPGCDHAPVWSPDGRSVAFARTTTDAAGNPRSSAILIVPAAGGTPRTLGFLASATAFSWAPGKQIVFVSAATPSQPPSLRVANPDGSGMRTLLSSAALTDRPVWAPGRDAIALVERRPDGSTDIYTVPAAGGQPVDITNTPGISETRPSWMYPFLGLGGGEPGPGVHVRSRSVRPHARRRR